MRFTDLFIRRPVLSIVVSLLILLIGGRALYELPIRQYPELSNTVITITTSYPGASPELMQGFITTPIEQAVASAEGLDYLTSSSTQGTSVVTAYVRLNFDPNVAMTDVMAKVQQVKYQLPREANDPVILKSTGETTSLLYMGFSSTELNGAAISDFLTRVIQPQLATIEGVAEAEILGGQTFAMRLWVDPVRMAARGITPADISAAIQANNYQSAPGQAKGVYTITNVTANTGLTDIEEFRNMVVKAADGALVRIRDVATVELGAQSTNASVYMNGQQAIFIGVNSTPTGNPLNIVQDIRRMVPDLERNLPPSMKMEIVYDSTRFIQASIDEVVKTLAEAVAIVVVVIFLFLGSFRSVLIPIVTIPLSIIGAATFMLAMGFSLNLLTLLAMVLAIGLVVDDAIVVVENVHRHLEEGRTPVQASLIGAREIVGPIISMTITLAAVYAPIGFLSGLTGTLFREFAFTLAGSVIISGVVALTLSPMMCSVILTPSMNHGRFARFVDRSFTRLEGWYSRRLAGSLDHRAATLLFGVCILGAVGFLFVNTSSELAPEEDQGILFGITKAPQYANLDYIDIYGKQMDAIFASHPETDTRFVLNGMPTLNQGFAGMILKPWDERTKTAQQLQPEVQGQLSGVTGTQVFLVSPPALPGSTGGLPVQMVIYSPGDYRTIFDAMERIKAAAFQSGMFIVADSDLQFNNPVIRLHIDRSKAADLGLNMQSVADTLAVLVGGNYVNRFNLQGRSYEVIPQVPREKRLSAEDLTRYYVKAANGQPIPLSTVVSFATDVQPNALNKYNQLNAATFSAVPMPGVTMGQAVEFLEQQAREILPAGFNHAYLSESRQYVTEGSQLTVTFIFALVVIFLVLAAQFESLRDPLVILVSVPMSIFGALLPLFFGVATMNIYTQVGLVTLVGLITKHGILMVEFAKEMQVNEQVDRRTAIEHAARVRLRPILMTTAAMVMGLVPLLSAAGAGAASRFSIGLVIVTGMLIGTLFTLFVLPAVYTVLAKDHRAAAASERNEQIAALS
ncbi:MexW/MexI family multidrug efflux RND transporter permease subunit [Azospirillum sp. RWY-5-1]|uniref:MexW/MexI family multidrug efflux RND transporter permease subunit n=1 Tax=Azospirillum oleiclasticum TaxID=2735135 RepID=A0ABX2TGB6_9PROT|nr:MexW/MexI family multidrug efflux RND transporter permease subunit [Azospirillum oleiclasticum]NYZ16728.1 MexW/MexI family multidrug efflux RND transporter permease subunit [Azospirillum oleiclasticum]NYZ23370.1 MexW/MexI family multidrug efflux RND transporter permease subunit [Azospirillum oleiclasticum]